MSGGVRVVITVDRYDVRGHVVESSGSTYDLPTSRYNDKTADDLMTELLGSGMIDSEMGD